uniref:Presenilin n=1 Tax=Ditylenchus dipsaci TaxID=166011 RepID=A0A915DEA1_9BILA
MKKAPSPENGEILPGAGARAVAESNRKMAIVVNEKQNFCTASADFLSQIVQVKPVIIAVLLNILLTLSLWIGVYKTQTDTQSVAFYLLDSRGDFTTGVDLYDGFLNGIMCIAALAVLSFVMLGFALYDFQMVVKVWLTLSCLLVNYVTSAFIFNDTIKVFGVDKYGELIAILLAFVYGTVGSMVFFTSYFPPIFHQFYVICNCSMVSVFYLRVFPNQTTWFVLAGVVGWDLFAVLSPLGPLRKVTEKASDYSEQILRLLTFDAKTVQEPHIACDDDETSEIEYDKSSNSSDESNDEVMEEGGRTAKDALQDSEMTRLGMGDFVFYSLLVGKAAAGGSFLATFNALIGVVVGLIITLTSLPDYEEFESIPALPISICLGLGLYFGTLPHEKFNMSFWRMLVNSTNLGLIVFAFLILFRFFGPRRLIPMKMTE